MAEKQNIRLLAAIMFADMVGYTKMMQQDEALAKTKRDHQRSIVDHKISKYRGNVMQYYGDGTLSMFTSAIDAVNAAKEIQLQEQPELNFAVKLAYIYAGIGEVDTTLEYLNLGYK